MNLSVNLKKGVILVSILLFIQNTAFAQKTRITNLKIANNRDNLFIYFNVQGMFPEKIKKSIINGVPATFSFFVTLYQIHDLWFGKKIVDLKITHDIKYNTLKKEFRVKRSWEKEKLQITKTFIETEQLLTNVELSASRS